MAEAMFSFCFRRSRTVPVLSGTSLEKWRSIPGELSGTIKHLSGRILRSAARAGMKQK